MWRQTKRANLRSVVDSLRFFVLSLGLIMSSQVANIRDDFSRCSQSINEHVFGQTHAVEAAFVALLTGGHVLLEGVPGLAKTLTIRSLARTLSCSFGRVQFTPDLMPLDIIGSSILHQNQFEFHPGPIFTELLLADEINRAPAKTQSALLEAMQESTVTADGKTHTLPKVFTVFATQNPIEQEGTYPLPESELDRFMMMVQMDYPSEIDELKVLREHHQRSSSFADAKIQPILNASNILAYREVVQALQVSDEVLDYTNRVVRATREHVSVSVGASPRAGLSLVKAAKASAALQGRDFVTPDDVKKWAYPVLRHRLVLRPGAELNGVSSDEVVRSLLGSLKVPT